MSKHKPIPLRQMTVSVRRTTQLVLVVPEGLTDAEVLHAVETFWDGGNYFLDGHGQVWPASRQVIVSTETLENEALVEEHSWGATADVPVRAVLGTWAVIAANAALADELAAQANAEHEQKLAAQDPAHLNQLALIQALQWLYPGNPSGSWRKLSRGRLVQMYRAYFAPRRGSERAEGDR